MSMPDSSRATQRAVAEAHRTEWAYVLASTARVTQDFDLAEECVQDAYVRALDSWENDGVPDRPGAWLTTVAKRRALDLLRREQHFRSKLPLLVEPSPPEGEAAPGVVLDDRLRLVFICCHPALEREAQIALTLKLVCGMSTGDIAQAFLVSKTTMAARITRAKKKISAARIAYRVPTAEELPARLDAVLDVILLLFTNGHTAPSGNDLVRVDFVERAVGLARMLHLLMPAEREVMGLLALLLVTDARRPTRTGSEGEPVPMEEQDRSVWNRSAIEEGHLLVLRALRGGPPGRFTLQAAISSLHAQAPSVKETDWPQVLALYDKLHGVWPSPVVALNRAVALSQVKGPEEAIKQITMLEREGTLSSYRYLPLAKADILCRLERHGEAAVAYGDALSLAGNEAERHFLEARIKTERDH
ncbi:RNA polymerase sigma factor [Nocardiopsis quinghaiensis]|uniref:RNA polymerase sigma factor n=1 Tax=Nocardiopsis quinghaiensis TaxID=464995 RepID=UPI001CC23CC8|nr:DUF6596 domain-containing protein [Nocardiopsis quinghaiensis]